MTSAATAIPGVGNASTIGKIVTSEVTKSVTQKAGSEFIGETAGNLAGGGAAAVVKSAEAYAVQEDKKK